MRTGNAGRRSAALALAVTTVVLSACGSSGESKKDFIARANAICNNTTRDVATVPAPSTSGTVTLPALARYLGAVAPIVASEAKQLNALPRPASDQSALRRYLAAVAATAGHYKALENAARSGDRQAISAATGALRASPASRLAAAYGLKECAGPSGTVQTSH
jgi:hypothetical protein